MVMSDEEKKKPMSFAVENDVRSLVLSLSEGLEQSPSWVGNQLLRKALGLETSALVTRTLASLQQRREV